MKYTVIYSILLGFVGLPFSAQFVFAHGVHGGISGCPVGGCGITDWYIAQKAFDNMFDISIVIYGAIVILFWFSLLKGKSISTIVRK